MKILSSAKCSYCDEIDDITHFFVSCRAVYFFWQSLFLWWATHVPNNTDINFPIFPTENDIIFGITQSNADKDIAVSKCIVCQVLYL